MLILLAALVWDLVFGELPNVLHPVAWMGHVIGFGRDLVMRLRSPRAQLVAGAVLAWSVPSLFAAASAALLLATANIAWAHFLIAVFLLKSSFALRELGAAGKRVAEALAKGDVAEGRYQLRSLCSRDARELGPEQIVSATIGSLAENISDSFIAPVFFYALFGVPGAVCYRAVNTLDAMIGYRGLFEYAGKVAARTDDAANFIPARLSAGLLLVSGALCGKPAWLGFQTMRADHAQTPSPNGGWPMATMAGLLRVEINKVGCYTLGTNAQRLSPQKIAEAWRLAFLAAALLSVTVLASLGVVFGLKPT